ncbi:MAG: thioredoxin family protein [Thermoguttaceae bacterium]
MKPTFLSNLCVLSFCIIVPFFGCDNTSCPFTGNGKCKQTETTGDSPNKSCCSSCKKNSSETDAKPSEEAVIMLNESNFAEKTAKGIVLVDFYADWCPPCRDMIPVVNSIAKKMSGKIVVAKLNTDQNEKLAAKYNPEGGIPAFVIFVDGEKKDLALGSMPEAELQKFIDKYLPKSEASETSIKKPETSPTSAQSVVLETESVIETPAE